MIKTFGEYNREIVAEQIMSVVAFMAVQKQLDEAAMDKQKLIAKADELLSKIGLSKRQEIGLLAYLKYAAEGILEILLYALSGDMEGVKRVASKVKKQHLIDFFLKLDVLTLHILSAPIHMIDAVTGWDLHANLRNAATKGMKAVVQSFEDALNYIKEKLAQVNIDDDNRQVIYKELKDLELAMAVVRV